MSNEEKVQSTTFAIVCDSGCDISLSVLQSAGVALVPLRVRVGNEVFRDCIDMDPDDFFVTYSSARGQVRFFSPTLEDYLECYQALLDEGYKDIISLHTAATLSDSFEAAKGAARLLDGARVHVIDSCSSSGKLALILARLVLDRAVGYTAEDAVSHVLELMQQARMLVVCAPNAPVAQGAQRKRDKLFGQVNQLKARALGLRRLYTAESDGRPRELLGSSDLTWLAGRMARTMSEYAAHVGALSYVEVSAGVPGQLSVIEKPLVTNEFESQRIAILTTNPSTATQFGVGAVVLAYVPARLLNAVDAAAFFNAQL